MRSGSCAVALALLAGLIASEARADVCPFFWVRRSPRPWDLPVRETPKPRVVRVVIEASDQVGETRLQIPRKLLGTLQANGQNGGGWGLPNVPLCSVALVLGPVLAACALRLGRAQRRFAFVGVGLLLVAVALCETLNVSAHPPPPRWITQNMTIRGQVVVEIVENGDAIKLILDKRAIWPTR